MTDVTDKALDQIAADAQFHASRSPPTKLSLWPREILPIVEELQRRRAAERLQQTTALQAAGAVLAGDRSI